MFAVVSCSNGSTGGGGISGGIDIIPTKTFWAQEATDGGAFYQLTAERLAENSRCEVWVERGSGVTAATARSIANEYANNIYQKMHNFFGWNENVQIQQNKQVNMSTMEFAHYLATGETSNAKLTILLLDIQDDYRPGVNESYVAGYFWPYDIFSSSTQLPAGYRSNKLDMIYLDTNPGLNNSEKISEAYMTLAHEMQHLMNFVSSYAYRVKDRYLYTMDLWIDEGLSSAAEWVYSGKHLISRVGWFLYNGDNKTMKGEIDKGNNFYVWGNRVTTSSPYAVLDDYATVYLFFQWLRLQSNSNIYKEIIKSQDYDNKAVINAFTKVTTGSSYSDWGSMLRDWLAANNNNSPTGRDGYKGELTSEIKVSYAPAGPTPTTIGLYPGEGVYSYSTSNPSFTPSGNIKYEYFSGNKTLLTYNVNPINSVDRNTSIDTLVDNNAQVTGARPPASINISGNFSLKLDSSEISGPFRIGMGDVIRMNNNNGNRVNFDMTKVERVFIDE